MRDNNVWRSPGKSIKDNDKFISLNSPLLNGANCCKNDNVKNICKNNVENIFGKHQRNLMMCRSADTLQTMASNTFTENMFRNKYNYKNNRNKNKYDDDKVNYKFRKIHT